MPFCENRCHRTYWEANLRHSSAIRENRSKPGDTMIRQFALAVHSRSDLIACCHDKLTPAPSP